MFCYTVSFWDERMHPLQNNEIYLVLSAMNSIPTQNSRAIYSYGILLLATRCIKLTSQQCSRAIWFEIWVFSKGNYVMPYSLIKCYHCFANVSEERLRKEKLYNSYFLQNIIGMIKLLKMKWAWYVARMGRKYIQSFGRKIYGKETTMNI
jgi:hypothetical protein